jgi:hypothetical protein
VARSLVNVDLQRFTKQSFVNPLTSIFAYPVLPQGQIIGVETQLVPAIHVRHKTLGADSNVEEQAMKELPGCNNRRHPPVSVN